MNLTFEKKVILLMSITPLLFVVLSLAFILYTNNTLKKREIENGKILAKTFSNSAALKIGVLYQEPNKLNEPFSQYLDEPSVIVTSVFLETGELLHSEIDDAHRETLSISSSIRADLNFSEIINQLESKKEEVVVDIGSDLIYLYGPIYQEKTVSSDDDLWVEDELLEDELGGLKEEAKEKILIGITEMGISLEAVKRSFWKNFWFSMIVTIIFVVGAGIVMRYIFDQWHAKTKELEEVIAMEKKAESQVREAMKELEEKNQQYEHANEDLIKTQLKLIQSQAQQVEQERLASLGELSGMVAHEINNALTGVIGPVDRIFQIAKTATPLDKEKIWYCWESDQEGLELQGYLEQWDETWEAHLREIHEAADLIQVAGKRARGVVDDLRGLVGGRSREYGPVDLCGSFNETVRLQKQKLADVKVITKFEEEKMEIISTSGQMGMIFMNMITNAVDALKGRENPTITVDMHHKGDGVEIFFGDNGCGMPFEVRSQIFNPFFSTKKDKDAVMGGTGLGLSTVRRYITQQGGTIHVDSEEGQGTTFVMWLPYERPEENENDDGNNGVVMDQVANHEGKELNINV